MLKALIITFFVAMVPVLELRGAIPIGMARGLDFWPALAAGVAGNLVPVPFIIIFVRKVFAWLRTKSEKLESLVSRMEKKAASNYDLIEKYEMLGLFILVAIPLPGTGAWTGALVAAMMDMRLKKAFPTIAGGVVAAGIIVSVISYGAGMLIG